MVSTLTRRPSFQGAHSRSGTLKAIRAILGAGGVDYAIIPVGDAKYENAAHTTVTTIGRGGGDGLVFTYSEARTAFDKATKHLRNQIGLPLIPLNGSDEEGDTPSTAFWSRGDDSNDFPFSIGAWVKLTDATASCILSKYETTGGQREWLLEFGSDDKLVFTSLDQSVVHTAVRKADVATLEGVWVFVVFTYDGAGGASAADSMTLYQDGALWASTAVTGGNYLAMENGTAIVDLGKRDGASNVNMFDGKMAGGPIGPFFTHQELTASQVAKLHSIGKTAQG